MLIGAHRCKRDAMYSTTILYWEKVLLLEIWNNNVAHYDHGKTSGPARKALQGPSIMSTVCQNCQNA